MRKATALISVLIFPALSLIAIPSFALSPPKLSAKDAAINAANDAALKQALLGTWQAMDSPTSPTINGEGTFLADGSATGFTTATYVYNDGYTSDVKVGLSFRWSVKNGVLTLNQFVSDPSQFIKPDHVKRFEILSISPEGMNLKDLSDGEVVYRRRKLG
ncbi:MAG: lipocalin family protein [Pseudomonadota bacterium]